MTTVISRILTPVVAGCALSACVSVKGTEYPSNWPSLQKTLNSGCNDLSGVYRNAPVETSEPAESKYGRWYPLTMQFAGFRWNDGAHGQFSETRIDAASVPPRVSARGSDGQWVDVPLRSSWKCEGGRLVGTPLQRMPSETGLFLTVKGTLTIERATDGSAIVHMDSRETGADMLVPYSVKDEAWWRHKDESSQQAR